jgi:hypothetical protein
MPKMMAQIRSWFSATPEITFRPHVGAPQVSKITRIQLASEVTPTWLSEQRKYENSYDKFQNCPGMHDLMQAGYIINAWDDIRIKANRVGTVAKMEKSFTQPLKPMNPKVVTGIAPIEKDMTLQVHKLNTPWSVTTRAGWSAMVLPATYHSPFLKDLYVYGGINDYEDFHIMNFIFSPLRECEVFIPAGTPLLQVIPYKRKSLQAVTGSATKNDLDIYHFSFPTRVRAAYRKLFHHRKTYLLEHQK